MVEHVGQPFAPIAAILDQHLPSSTRWTVRWDGESAIVSTDGGSFTISSGSAWGPYAADDGAIAEVVHEAFRAVRGPLYDRLIDRMFGRPA